MLANKDQKQIDLQEKKVNNEEKKLKDLKSQLLEEQQKDIYLEIPEKNILITTKLQYLGKTYPEILKEVNEEEIADYNLLQELRNEGKESNWKKYGFLKRAYAFVPNPDEASKANGFVAWFYVDSDGAYLNCGYYAGYSDSTLGVFLVKKIKSNVKQNKKNK